MNPQEYTKEMREDFEKRVNKAAEYLKELKLRPQATVNAVNVGDDVFAQKVTVYLEDLKFKSPIQQSDLKK